MALIEVIKKSDLLKTISGLNTKEEIVSAINEMQTMGVNRGGWVPKDWTYISNCGIPHWDSWYCRNCKYVHHGDVHSLKQFTVCPNCHVPMVDEEEE